MFQNFSHDFLTYRASATGYQNIFILAYLLLVLHNISSSIFSRREEYNPLISDQYQRFPYYLSKHRNILEPEVSKFLIGNGLNLEVEYPEDKKFAVCLTHDIDAVYPSRLSVTLGAAKSLMQHQIKNAFKTLLKSIKKRRNLWWNFKDIMALEAKYGAKSSFYFLALNTGERFK